MSVKSSERKTAELGARLMEVMWPLVKNETNKGDVAVALHAAMFAVLVNLSDGDMEWTVKAMIELGRNMEVNTKDDERRGTEQHH